MSYRKNLDNPEDCPHEGSEGRRSSSLAHAQHDLLDENGNDENVNHKNVNYKNVDHGVYEVAVENSNSSQEIEISARRRIDHRVIAGEVSQSQNSGAQPHTEFPIAQSADDAPRPRADTRNLNNRISKETTSASRTQKETCVRVRTTQNNQNVWNRGEAEARSESKEGILRDTTSLTATTGSTTASETAASQTRGTKTSKIKSFIENVLLSHFIQPPSLFHSNYDEDQREEAYAEHTLELYRQRVRLVMVFAIFELFFHTLFYIYVSPDSAQIYQLIYATLIILCLFAHKVAQEQQTQAGLRRLCLNAYTLFSIGAALIVGVMGNSHNLILGGHNHIILTTLLLPFTVGDCLLVGTMTITSLAVSGWITFMPGNQQLYFSQLFTLCTTTAFVVFVSFFQDAMRRRAFDASFDAMCSVTRYQYLSLHDTLTNGHNRRYLLQTLDTEIARAARFSRPISLILFDLDNFKRVNDTLGHAAGDRVLMEVWDVAARTVRNVDTPARYGGDEFAIALPEADEDEAYAVAARLQSAASAHMIHVFGADSVQGQVTLSIGIVTLRPRDIVPAEELLGMADSQLYKAKKTGKNRIV